MTCECSFHTSCGKGPPKQPFSALMARRDLLFASCACNLEYWAAFEGCPRKPRVHRPSLRHLRVGPCGTVHAIPSLLFRSHGPSFADGSDQTALCSFPVPSAEDGSVSAPAAVPLSRYGSANDSFDRCPYRS